MNQKDVIRMAREAFIARGFWPNEVMWDCWKNAWLTGAAAEREACAKVCDDLWQDDGTAYACREAIRARGEK